MVTKIAHVDDGNIRRCMWPVRGGTASQLSRRSNFRPTATKFEDKAVLATSRFDLSLAFHSMRCVMSTRIPLITFAVCIATLSSIAIQPAQAKQQCASTRPSPHGYWSWRLIDGRKCWFEGKSTLSKSLLEWPARASTQTKQASTKPNSDGEPTSVRPQKPGNPLDSQAWAPNDSDSFEARWRAIGMAY